MSERDVMWNEERTQGYARWTRLGSRLFYAPFARQIVRSLPPVEARSTIVDLGTGPGLLSVELCRLLPQVRVMGVDPSAEMLEVARRNADQAGVPNYETRLGGAEQLPLRSGSAGLVVSQSSFHEWDDAQQGLLEVFRVLEPGGQVILKEYNRAWLSAWKRTVFGRFHHLDMFRFTFREVADLFRGAGFSEIRGEEGGLQFIIYARKPEETRIPPP